MTAAGNGNALTNRTRAKIDRRRQVRGEAVHRELLRRLKRAEGVAASIPEEELPSEEQREAHKLSHTPLFNVVMDLVKSESSLVIIITHRIIILDFFFHQYYLDSRKRFVKCDKSA